MNKEDNKVEDEIVEEQEVVENADETTEEVVEEVTAEDETSKLQNDYNKLKDDYIRLYAEMDNMKKRSQLETEKTIKFAISSFAKELLGVADNLERAITAMENNKESCEDLLKGVELTQNELTKVFEKFGIKRFNHMGQKFDPNFERVVQEIEDKKKESGTIIAELQAGYVIHDRILREAMVIVAR
ncbi:MAG: nucleotide exchange factor GrpE [Alphaproteobacteria bacterium]|nr:nucleotide exchange factor GrpE [Alphaproteobacteria bacterium]